jgi:pimeloyl-ACP methyl ester carboxylesterase
MNRNNGPVVTSRYGETYGTSGALAIETETRPLNRKKRRRILLKYQAAVTMLTVLLVFNILKFFSSRVAARWLNHTCWFHPWHTPEREWDTASLHSARQSKVTSQGKPLAVYTWGEGKPVLLVHGWGGRGLQFSGFVQPLVGAGFKLVTFDAPAHGRSPGSRTDFLEIAEAVRTVAEHIGPLHALISHSAGCIPILLAMQHGVVARRVVCISPVAAFATLLHAFVDKLHLSKRIAYEQRRLLETSYGDDLFERLSPTTIVRDIPAPALIVHDRDDAEVAWSEGWTLAKAWPSSCLVSTAGLGHYRVLRDPMVVKKAIDFLISYDEQEPSSLAERESVDDALASTSIDAGLLLNG